MVKGATVRDDELFDPTTGEFVQRKLRCARVSNGGDYSMSSFGPSLTRQDMAAECDINAIMNKYRHTGTLPASMREPMYLDLADAPDYMAAMNSMIAAKEAFMRLPSDLRKRLDNDPGQFVEYAMDPANLGEMRKYGLAKPEEPAPPPPPPVPAPPPAAPPAAS